MRRHLVLLTSSFPYGPGEPFLDAELPFLERQFDRITIVSDTPANGARPAALGPKVTVIASAARATPRDLHRILPPRHLVAILRELRSLWRGGGGISVEAGKILLGEYLKALALVRYLRGALVLDPEEQCHLYSYWHDYKANALALWKVAHPESICVARFHRWDVYAEHHPAGYLPFKQAIFEGLDRSYAISDHGQAYAARRFSVEASRMRVARLGTCDLGPPPDAAPDGPLQLLSVSQLIPRKRVDLVIEALARVEVPLTWTHVGDGVDAERLRRLARDRLGAKPNIAFDFAGGLAHEAMLPRLVGLANPLFINVSSSEGIPVSIMEAMSAGIPTMATDVGGSGELVRSNVNGLLLRPDPSPDEIAEEITRYQRLDAESRRRYRLQAYATWQSRYDASQNFPAFVADLLSLEKKPAGR